MKRGIESREMEDRDHFKFTPDLFLKYGRYLRRIRHRMI